MSWLNEIMRKPPPAIEGEVNHSTIDRFTFVHMAIGVGYGFFGLSLAFTLVLAVLWEIVENPMKVRVSFLFPSGTADTLRNAVGDVFAVLVGWLMGGHLAGFVGGVGLIVS